MKKVLTILLMLLFASSSFAIYRAGMSYTRKGSEGSQYKRYGRWEMRMRYIGLNGTVNCFVLVADGAVGANPTSGPWQEYDMEICGNRPDHISTTLHINHWGNTEFTTGRGGGFDPYEGFNLDFHTWGCEWTPDYVTWEVDGEIYRKSERIDGRIHDFQYPIWNTEGEVKEVVHDYDWIKMWSNDSLRCAFDVWECSGDLEGWCGLWDPINDGRAVFYCFFRHYIYTPGAGPNGSDFTLEFSEEYDGTEFDTTAWAPYGCELRGGFAIGAFGAPYTDDLPVDSGDVSYSADKAVRGFSQNSLQINFTEGNLRFSLADACMVTVALYDLSGKKVRIISDSYMEAGRHSVLLDNKSIPAGTYLVSLNTPGAVETERIVLMSR